ncbi:MULTISPECIES: outer-membrane lipoprotein carrier protein LolA [unclassified Chelatococcus]|uniref:outer-membrane lipoprotein carrier protein LolA n=1 Tax=unclassified Chelatococcus TaxID=2638111 RepID=UPI001BCF5C36|nr:MULTISPECIES: outer-membrane lipoprotein carrier protein LolA [unclassified Chelatococcus]MBS7696914.1 outer-membrane lipoprotein carrier protein LolA [Chelatococcus sp. YT9]MBX3555904.1 outer-membrane lipoprotein carrier protein LolA [Chelatococcus sp.]
MKRFGCATLALVAAFAASGGVPVAQAQNDPLTRFLDGMFGKAPAEGPAQDPAPARAAPAPAPVPAPPRANTASSPAAPPQAATPAAPSQSAAGGPPLPPRRPVALGGGDGGSVQPVATAAPAAPAAPVASIAPAAAPRAATNVVPTSQAAAIERVNSYVNSIDTLTGRFVQYGGDGRRAEGTLYIQRPGRLRFAYNPPSTLEIVADGRSVAIRDSKLKTNDVYPIGQTPLKFLLKDRFDLTRDTKVRAVDIGNDGVVTVSFEDSATIGGTSRITLRFDARNNALRQWTVVDPQGYETSVALSDLRLASRAQAE